MPPASSPPPRPPSVYALALRQTLRDLRAGELRLLIVAVMLAVAALSAVGLFADRLERQLARDALQLIGGDAVVASDQPLPPAFAQQAAALGLRSATTVSFPSMGRADDARGGAARLVAVKAVSDAYPLRGRLQLRTAADAPVFTAPSAPARGRVWVDPALVEALQVGVGDTLWLGDAALVIDHLIVVEPARGAGFMALAPRVLLHQDDLAATGLIQPASRVSYRLLVAAAGAGPDAAVRDYTAWAQARIEQQRLRGVRIESLDSGQPAMQTTLERARLFLNLVALLAALLAAVAVAIAARDYAARHLDDCAMLRVLGLSQRRIALSYALGFVAVGVGASVAGVALGLAVQQVFVAMLAGLVDAALPAPGLVPALFGVGVGLTLLVAFGLPPVLQLARVPALRVIRRELGTIKPASALVLVAGTLGFGALLLAASSDLLLGLIAVGGFAAAVALFAALAWAAVALLRRAVPQSRAPRWLLLATRQIAARPGFAVLQVSALAVGLLALVLLVLLRTDLISSWRQATPPDAPDRFVINIQPDQGEAFRRVLAEAGVARYDWYPMIRGRLVAINGRPVDGDDFADERARRMVEREFNLSHDARLPAHNRISAGRWRPDEADGLSVEDGLARTLGIGLGDTLAFDIAGVRHEGRVSSLRAVDWASMRVNFFVMFPRAAMPELPTTYIAGFRAPPQAGFDAALTRQFPNITSVDLSASLAQVQRVLDQVIRAVEVLFGFTLAAGLVVLFAAVTATRQARSREYALMRAMGASRALLVRVQRAELLGVGALAGVLASLVALLLGWALARYAFGFDWNAPAWVVLAGGAAGALLALAAGWWGLRDVLRQPVVQTLRQATGG